MNKNSFQRAALVTAIIAFPYALIYIDFSSYSKMNLFVAGLFFVSTAIAIFSGIKKERDSSQGIPKEDELSKLVKYKSGYLALICSFFVWMGIYFFRDDFSSEETMLATGLIFPAIIFLISKLIVKIQLRGK